MNDFFVFKTVLFPGNNIQEFEEEMELLYLRHDGLSVPHYLWFPLWLFGAGNSH